MRLSIHDTLAEFLIIDKGLISRLNISNKGVSICHPRGSVSHSCDRIFYTKIGLVTGIYISVIHLTVIYNQIENLVLKTALTLLVSCNSRSSQIVLEKTADIHGLIFL
jgi:hypothetical protein